MISTPPPRYPVTLVLLWVSSQQPEGPPSVVPEQHQARYA
jgi:hypothetical protein